MHLLALSVVFAFVLSHVSSAKLTDQYYHTAILDPQEKYQLHWTVNRTEKKIYFAVQVNTTGWIGLGFSQGLSGQMKGADIVMGWVDKNGTVHFKDRHGVGNRRPFPDVQQDYFLKGAEETNGQTILKFERSFDTCDSHDYKVTSGTVKVIYAYHTEDPESNSEIFIKQHTARGAKSLNLLSYVKNSPPPKDAKYFDVVNQNAKVPSTHTTYWCQAFKLPEHINTKHHIVEIAPIIQKGNEALVHHFVVYECVTDIAPHHLNQTGPCRNPVMPKSIRGCLKISMYAWAVGGKNFKLPDHVGMPIGTNDTVKYIVLETHFDNPNRATGLTDNSGLRFYYTKNLRQHDAGTLVQGQMVSTAHLIPPMQSNWITRTYCPKELSQHLKSSLPDNSINIFATFPHEHLAGSGIWTKHVRDGKELPEIVRDDFYDFNYQQTYLLPNEIKFKPGDEISTYCKYNTMNKKVATTGGESTREEMCLNYMMYYPKIKMRPYCLSGVQNVSDVFSAKYATLNPKKQGFIKSSKPWDWEGVNWTQKMIDELKEILAKDSLVAFGFGKYKVFKSRPKILQPLVKTDTCQSVGSGTDGITLSTSLLLLTILSVLMSFQVIR